MELFYYFVKSGTNHQKDPLILWLPGGPGCSVLSALVYEIGTINNNKLILLTIQTYISSRICCCCCCCDAGPISFEGEYDDDDDGGLPTLILNPYSWTQVNNN